MWNDKNGELVRKYRYTKTPPSNGDYGEYVFGELSALGYEVRPLTMVSGSGAFIAAAIPNGASAVLMFKSADTLDRSDVKQIQDARLIYGGASVYMIVFTGNCTDERLLKYMKDDDIRIVMNFEIGDEVCEILSECGFLPNKVYDMMLEYSSELDRRWREEEQRRIEAERTARAERERFEREAEERRRKEAEEAAGRAGADYDRKFKEAVKAAVVYDVASIGGLSHRLGIDREYAKKLIADMERQGVIGPSVGGSPREVIMTPGVAEARFGITIDGRSGASDFKEADLRNRS